MALTINHPSQARLPLAMLAAGAALVATIGIGTYTVANLDGGSGSVEQSPAVATTLTDTSPVSAWAYENGLIGGSPAGLRAPAEQTPYTGVSGVSATDLVLEPVIGVNARLNTHHPLEARNNGALAEPVSETFIPGAGSAAVQPVDRTFIPGRGSEAVEPVSVTFIPGNHYTGAEPVDGPDPVSVTFVPGNGSQAPAPVDVSFVGGNGSSHPVPVDVTFIPGNPVTPVEPQPQIHQVGVDGPR